MNDESDRRREPRIPHDQTLFLRVLSASEQSRLAGRTFHCVAEDASSSGVRLRLDTSLPVGCRVELWIGAPGRTGTLVLAGEVKWSRPGDQKDAQQIGIELQAQDPEQKRQWNETIADLVEYL